MLKEQFENDKEPLLNIYITAGFPQINSLPEILSGLEEAGVDMVEVGMPYSDPLSDGPTIQNSSSIAIRNGMNMEVLFDQLTETNINIPVILMGYFNSVFLYGVEQFCEQCCASGVSGVILPDLPIDVYQEKYQAIFERNNISFIFLVTPQTSVQRIQRIDECSTSFIYAVSSSSTTGKNARIQDAEPYLARLSKMQLNTPIMVGFSIATKEDFDFVAQYTAGSIIGSAFIRRISNSNNLKKDIQSFVHSIRD